MERKLGFWDVFSIAAGAMISSGLFVLPGIAFAQAGPAVVLSYGLAAVLIIPAVLCQAELATAVPRAGATYVFIERSLGSFPGVFAGLASWFSIALKAAFALIGIGAFARLVWPMAPDWIMKAVAAGFCVVFAALNVLTVKGVGRLQTLMVAGLLAMLLFYIVAAKASGQMAADRFAGFYSRGTLEMLAVSGAVFVSFGGLTATADIAGEVRNAGRNLPLAMLAALTVVGVLYVAVVFVTVATSQPEQLAGSLTPLSDAAGRFIGGWGVILLACAAMLAFITTANGGLLEASRSPVAMSRDGLLPRVLQIQSRRFGTPVVSVLMTSAAMLTVIILLSVEQLVKVASTMLLVLYSLTCLSVIIMRTSRIQNYRPTFRAPLVPVLPVLGIGTYIFLIADMGLVPLLTTAGFAAGGAVWWWFYVRPGYERESALAFMVRTVVAKEMRRSGLEEELKHIAFERDDLQQDRFDRLVQNCPVLDLPASVHSDEQMFAAAAEALAPRLEMPASELAAKLTEREAQSSTVLQPGLAVPHVIVEGTNRFELALVRSRDGLRFGKSDAPVRLVFVLVGSTDQRNFHLRALMAIASVVQEPGFVEAWLAADHAEQLRDLLLLSGRARTSSAHPV